MSSVCQSGRRETKKRSNLNKQSTVSVIHPAAQRYRGSNLDFYTPVQVTPVAGWYTQQFFLLWQTLQFLIFLLIMVLPRFSVYLFFKLSGVIYTQPTYSLLIRDFHHTSPEIKNYTRNNLIICKSRVKMDLT